MALKATARASIIDLQNSIQDAIGDEEWETSFPVKHYFAPGNYAREMFLPKGHVIVGKIHKHAHLNIISYGHVLVSTPDGQEELKGPLTFTSEPGTKRAVYILEDTLWTTIHPTESTDVEEIEEEIIAKTFKEFDIFQKNLLLEKKENK